MIPVGPFQLGIFWDSVTWKERDKGAVCSLGFEKAPDLSLTGLVSIRFNRLLMRKLFCPSPALFSPSP